MSSSTAGPAGTASAATSEAAPAATPMGSTRDACREALLELAAADPRIYCLDADMGGLEEAFGGRFPDRYINVGIAEANLMGVAAGLAMTGKIPCVHTMAGFVSARACEQVKLDIAYNCLPVKLLASHSGVSAGHLGPTHHATEDLAIMRALPNMIVIAPADAAEAAAALRAAIRLPGPVYLRLGRKATPTINDREPDFMPGRAVRLREGGDITLLASGPHPVAAALEAADELAAAGIAARVLNVHTIKPLDVAAIVAAARETRALVTVEEHNIHGGLGGAVAEVVTEHAPAPVRRIGIPDVFCGRVGGPEDLLAACGVTARAVADTARDLLR